MIGLAAGMEMADMAWEVKCREEDMKQRALENERHAIDDARRGVDEKAEQLKVLANQSALFAGFSMVVLVESNVHEGIHWILLTVFGGTTACVIALMLVSTLNSTYMLVAILRYDCVNRPVPFEEFWRKRCEPDWKLALRAFSYGVPLFMVVVALVAWVTFWDSDKRYVSASVVTFIVLLATVFWFLNTERKWSGFLLQSEARVLTRGMSISSTHQSDEKVGGEGTSNRGSILSHRLDDDDGEHSSNAESSAMSLNISSLAVGELTASDRKVTANGVLSLGRRSGKSR